MAQESINLSEPVPFDRDRLEKALEAKSEQFKCIIHNGTVHIMYDDIWGHYSPIKDWRLRGKSGNYIEFVQLHLDSENNIVAVSPGDKCIDDNYRALSFNDLTIPEFIAVNEFRIKHQSQGQGLLAEFKARGSLPYTELLAPEDPPFSLEMLEVGQGAYGSAHGPCKNIKVIGTSGLGPCVGVAFVTRDRASKIPKVTVCHFDAGSDVEKTFDNILYHQGRMSANTEAYVATSQETVDLTKILSELKNRGIDTRIDIPKSRLLIDLDTGLPVDTSKLRLTALFKPILAGIAMGNAFSRAPLREDFRLQDGAPDDLLPKPNPLPGGVFSSL